MERGTIHVISEIGGCILDLPPDKRRITKSLRTYASRQDMAHLELLDPLTDKLGKWADMANFAIENYRIEGPVLVGIHCGDRVLLGVSKRYGYPRPGEPLHDILKVVRFPD